MKKKSPPKKPAKKVAKKAARKVAPKPSTPAKDPDRLTLKQRLFVEAYLGEAKGNATEAARLAGYKGSNKTLQVVGAENLSKPIISKLLTERVERAAMTADEVLDELTRIAKTDWQQFVDIQTGRSGEVIGATLQLKDKLKALELLGRYHKLFTERHEHSGPGGGPIRTATAQELSDDELAAIASGKAR